MWIKLNDETLVNLTVTSSIYSFKSAQNELVHIYYSSPDGVGRTETFQSEDDCTRRLESLKKILVDVPNLTRSHLLHQVMTGLVGVEK